MKNIAFCLLVFIMLMTTISAAAQWSWSGQIYFGTNQNLNLPVTINGDVEVTVAEGFTVRAPLAVKGNGYTMTKKGGGRFWFQADNPQFDINIIYSGKSDTIQLNGIFGAYSGNDSIGYVHTKTIFSSHDSTSLFYLHQNDTVVQTLDASGYNKTDTTLFIYSDTKSKLRLIKSSDSLSGKVYLTNGGTLYIDGTHNAELLVAAGGKLITGEKSTGTVVHDYTTFANTFNHSAITINNSTMKIGMYGGPSLAYVTSGNVNQNNNSVLEIDVYNPTTNWSLTSSGSQALTLWGSVDPYSDKIYMENGNYNFDAGSTINVTWDPTYASYRANDTVFYLPVIMLTSPSQINVASVVAVSQTLPGWRLEFIVASGQPGTTSGWGYIRARRILMQKDASLYGVQNNGTYANPVSVLYRDTVTYTLRAYNPGTVASNMTITDTLPPYLKWANEASGTPSKTTTTGTPPYRDVLTWTISSASPGVNNVFTYKATPESGACASQPLFINKAYVEIQNYGDILETNKTYHQGVGISVVSFSASLGGMIFNAGEQALDYRTTPRAGILIAPDEGYEFAGWSHGEYTSLRGEKIKAASGIIHYENIVIYGNVELRANFAPIMIQPKEKGIIKETINDNSDKVWTNGKNLYIRTSKGKIVSIYSTESILRRQFITTADNITTVELERGIYIVTLNNDGIGHKVRIE